MCCLGYDLQEVEFNEIISELENEGSEFNIDSSGNINLPDFLTLIARKIKVSGTV